jgi:pimeloyl-ACP methyl ester carboxylesterase
LRLVENRHSAAYYATGVLAVRPGSSTGATTLTSDNPDELTISAIPKEEGMSTTVDSAAGIRPFTLEIAEEAPADLKRRIKATRWPDKELVADASQGVQLAMLQELARYWSDEYSWPRFEEKLNALPQFLTKIDGLDIHFIHVKSAHEDAMPLIITHGWPGSVIEMLEVIGPLTDPTAFGGNAEDAFDVVIPSIPGFGFSEAPKEVGWGPGRIAKAWAELMSRLGYDHYVAQGGDQGATITDALGRLAPDGLIGMHFNLLSAAPRELVMAAFNLRLAFSADDREELGKVLKVVMRGYIAEMGEHPQTVGYPLADSPLGLAAWMLDHDADSYEKISRPFLGGEPTGGLTRDHVLDNISLYWLTNTPTSAGRVYWEESQGTAASIKHPPPHVTLPVGYTVFPDELFQAPKHWIKSAYHNLIYYNVAEKGGHFAAWEEPEVFAGEMRAAFRSLR